MTAEEDFDKFKARSAPSTLAGFVFEHGGAVQIIPPGEMLSMTPTKLKARLKVRGVAGTFGKGVKSVVFTVLAGKGGGHADQPWVKQGLRSQLGVSVLEVDDAPDGEFDPDPDERPTTQPRPTPRRPDPVAPSPDALSGLDTLDAIDPAPPAPGDVDRDDARELDDPDATAPDLSGLRAELALAWEAGRRALRAWARAVAKDPDVRELPELDARLRLLDDLLPSPAPLLDALTAVEGAGPGERTAAQARALRAADELLDALADDRLELLESNSVAPAGAVPPIEAALRAAVAALT